MEIFTTDPLQDRFPLKKWKAKAFYYENCQINVASGFMPDEKETSGINPEATYTSPF
jgi:hypothetical protein